MSTSSKTYLDGRQPIAKHLTRLPHWEQPRVLQFVTWNLGDALPVAAIRKLQVQRNRWLLSHPKPWDEETEKEYAQKFISRWERWLDCGRGSCILKNREVSKIVADALEYFHPTRYLLDSYVIMPNHVHVLFSPDENQSMDQLLHSWKSYTSHAVSASGLWQGKLWMKDYWDRMIRSHDHYLHVRNYIHNNSVKAKLRPDEYVLWMSMSGGPASRGPAS